MFVIAWVVLLWRCSEEPGRTLVLDDEHSLTLNGQTSVGQTIANPFSMDMDRGRSVTLLLGNPSEESVAVRFSGSAVAETKLDPGSWTEIETVASGRVMSLRWQGPDLFLARPYIKPGGEDSGMNVLLISIDTLRYDHFTSEHMPATRALFEKGVIFENIYTPTPWTLPAHASLFTALYPVRHGVRRPGHKLSDKLTTLGEVFQSKGYRTIALTEGNYVSPTFGLHHGFHVFHEDPPAMMNSNPSVSRLADNLARLRLATAPARNAPRFVFFHTYEVHCPYLPRDGLTDPGQLGATRWLLDNDGKELTSEIYEHLRALYRGEVRYTDRLLAPLLEELVARGDWIVALVSDHGEEFGEHGGLLHADMLYEEATRVPFALIGHGGSGLNRTAGSLVDAPATLLGCLGWEAPATWQGRDLRGVDDPARLVFSESFFFGIHRPAQDPRTIAVWQAWDKLIQTRNHGKIGAELFDLREDRGERSNLVEDRAARRDAMFLMMETYLANQGVSADEIDQLTPEQIEVMRSLGYIK